MSHSFCYPCTEGNCQVTKKIKSHGLGQSCKEMCGLLMGHWLPKLHPTFPGSFDKAPRNPAEKISSGYKAWEYLIYVYGLCPALLKTVLPDLYWEHLCKLAVAMRILHQHTISAEEVQRAYDLIVDFVETFEDIFYQKEDRKNSLLSSKCAWPITLSI